MRNLVLACLCLWGIGSALADISKEKAIACYNSSESEDTFSACLSTDESSKTIKEWSSDIKKDPLTDKSIYTAILVANGDAERFDATISLVVRCKDSKTEMYIVWNDYLGSKAYVTLRVGNSKAQTREWILSTNSKATFYPTSPINTLKDILSADKVIAQVTPYNENPVTVEFKTKGADEALKGVREGCKW